MNMSQKMAAEFLGTLWLVLGGCGSAVLAAAFPEVGIGLLGVALAFGLTVLTMAFAIANLLKDADLVASTSEAMRMIKQGAVKMDGEKLDDSRMTLPVGTVAVFQVGKRKFAKVTLV